jgi:hypothetical protein
MDRRVSILAVCVASLFAASGCQDYNFNPVGHCLIQPGTKRITLSNISTADVLFVVDDSGSMAGKQAALATNFGQFLNVLNTANVERVGNDLDPIDFHIAVTTTSNFVNYPVSGGSTCRNDCLGASGYVCCLSNRQPQPPQCLADTDCATGFTCQSCSNASLVWPVGGGSKGCYQPLCGATQPIGCSSSGAECGVLEQIYLYDPICDATTPINYRSYTKGLLPEGKYPMGRFLADPANATLSTAAAKGAVLHFNKDFYLPKNPTVPQATANAAAIADLSTAFARNVKVGICGSGQEQGLEPARMAIQRVQGVGGLAQTSGPGTVPYVAGDFLHDNSKLVVAWVSDEDDCSSPSAPASGVVFPPPPLPDGCVADASLPEAQQREYRLSAYADYFTSLGRPFSAAFIVSSNNGCQDATCTPMTCIDSTCSTGPLTCGGQGVPSRYINLAAQLRGRGVDVVVGSICDSFGTTLGRIGEIVKPPVGLVLPTQPAASEVTILRIARADGSTRKTCRGPAPAFKDPPTNLVPMTYADAVAAGYDWWFTATRDQVLDADKAPSLATKYVFINHATLACEANPGETYSADYLGQLPPGGCVTETDCTNALGGKDSDWSCVGYIASPERRGTCTCQ